MRFARDTTLKSLNYLRVGPAFFLGLRKVKYLLEIE